MTGAQFDEWHRAYIQEPWGELRDDLRMAAMLALEHDSASDVSPVWPYIETEEEAEERRVSLDRRKATLDPVSLEERLKKAREAHIAKYGQKKHG